MAATVVVAIEVVVVGLVVVVVFVVVVVVAGDAVVVAAAAVGIAVVVVVVGDAVVVLSVSSIAIQPSSTYPFSAILLLQYTATASRHTSPSLCISQLDITHGFVAYCKSKYLNGQYGFPAIVVVVYASTTALVVVSTTGT